MKWLILLHVLGATIWAGGHLILTLGFLPRALRDKDITTIVNFETNYERIGIPALIIQVITGFWMVLYYVPFSYWWSLDSPHHYYLWIKISLLLGTILLAVHARLFIIPKLTVERLPSLAFHIVLATLLAVAFVITGLSFRFTYF
ncbi:MAG TPA: CopD family protein [Cyclobacteriaceae bacterium]|nr:CopD family protein [Cyclobacteriaceae bacterium]HPW64468.1 CopD family protein [Cyclobacteriaceae bacterium]